MAYMVHQESGSMITMTGEPLIISKEWILELGKRAKKVQKFHAKIEQIGEGYYLEPVSGAQSYYDGCEVTERVQLHHNGVMAFGDMQKGAIFIFKDEVQRQKRMDTQRIRFAQLDHSNLKTAAEKMSRAFFRDVPTTLKDFCRYLLAFMIKNFRVHRGVMYAVEVTTDGKGGKWIPVVAQAMTAFVPPRAILDRVWKSKEPERFSLPDVEDTADLSRSIVEDRVVSAICFPLLHQEDLVGVLYVDTQDRQVQLSQDDMIVLCTMMPGISGMFYALLTHENHRIRVDKFLSAMARIETSQVWHCIPINKTLESFSLAKRGEDGSDVMIFCRITHKNPKLVDFTLPLAAYAGILALLETLPVRQLVEEVIIREVAMFARGRFDPLNITMGVVAIQGDSLRFSGVGAVSLVIKPPQRNAYFFDVTEQPIRGQETLPEAFESEISPGTIFVMSPHKPEPLCTTFDRITRFQRILEDLRKTSSGCLIAKRLELGEDDEDEDESKV